MDRLFFQVPEKELEGPSVDLQIVCSLDGRGNLVQISALDKRWPMLPLTTRYIKYPGIQVPGAHGGKDRLDLWRANSLEYHDQLQNLVMATSYDRFWCQVLHQPKELMDFLRSFVNKGFRSYDLAEMESRDAELHSRISAFVFFGVAMLCCNRRLKIEHISPKVHSEIVRKVIRLPFLMDFCALYQSQNFQGPLLTEIISTCFDIHRRLFTDLRISIRDIGDSIFQPLEEKLSPLEDDSSQQPESELSHRDLVDVMGYVCDILCTLQRMILTFRDDLRVVLRESKLHIRLVQFAEKVVWILNQEVHARLLESTNHPESPLTDSLRTAKNKGDLIEFALVDAFQRLECPGLATGTFSGAQVAVSLSNLLETLPQHQRFAILYEKWAPIGSSIRRAKELDANVEESVVDFLVHAVKEAFLAEKMPWEFATSGIVAKKAANLPKYQEPVIEKTVIKNEDRGKHVPATPSTSGPDQSDAVTDEIMEMLAGMSLESKYVKACVIHYKCDLNATVDAILSGSVPVSITEATAMLEQPKPAPVIVALSTPKPTAKVAPLTPMQQFNFRPVGTVIEKVYFGKRNLYEETEEETIDDETRAITVSRVQQMYDDEYDDTYDDFEGTDAVARLNERKDLVASELKTMAEDKESSDQEENGNSVPAGSEQTRSKNDAAQSQRGTTFYRGRGLQVSRGKHNDMRGGYRGGPANTHMVQREVERREGPDEIHAAEERDRPKDAWTAQMTAAYEKQVDRRPQPRAAPQPGDPKSRANKEKNKAHHGNHNRKDRGEWKRNQGMF